MCCVIVIRWRGPDVIEALRH